MKIFISVIMLKDIGGISTSTVNLLSEIAHEHDVTLCVLGDYISEDIKLPKNVKIIKGSKILKDCYCDRDMLSQQTNFQKTVRSIRRLARRLIGTEKIVNYAIKKVKVPEEYDVAIAYSNDIYAENGKLIAGGVNSFVLKNVKATKKISWIHNDAKKIGFTKELCIKMFKDYDAIVNVSYDCKYVFDEIILEFTNKSFVVYNMFDLDVIKEKAEDHNPYENNGKIHFVTVARLYNHQKRIDRIIETVHRLKTEGYTNFDWTIVGEGGDRQMLEEQISEKNVGDIITLAGLKQNPYPYVKNADAFVLTSTYEGYPMTVKEAQIVGAPTLVTEYGSAYEQVEDGVDGLVCDNSVDGVYDMIKKVLDDKNIISDLRKNLEENPITNKKALEQFTDVCK